MRTHGCYAAQMAIRRVRGAIHRVSDSIPGSPVPRKEEEAKQVIALRAAGVTPREIPAKVGVSRKFVNRILENSSYTYLPRPQFPPFSMPRTPERVLAQRVKRYYEREKPARHKAYALRNASLGIQALPGRASFLKTLERDKAIIKMRCEGMRPSAIASHFGIDEDRVYRVLNGGSRQYLERPNQYPKLQKVSVRRVRKITPEIRGEIVKAIEQGPEFQEKRGQFFKRIAEQCSLSIYTVLKIHTQIRKSQSVAL